jgi:hypothetical protein
MTSSVFLNFFIHKKSLVKPVSLNFLQTLTETALQHILPTIFQYYTKKRGFVASFFGTIKTSRPFS